MYSLHTVKKIADVPKAKWDAIAPDPFMTYGWLQTVEKTYLGGVRPSYHMAWDGDSLIGAAIAYLVEKDRRLFSIDNFLWGRFEKYTRKLGITFLPAMLCGSMAFEGGHTMLDGKRSPNDRKQMRSLLLEAIETEARCQNLPVCFSHIKDEEHPLGNMLEDRGYDHALIPPTYYLDIDWTSFDGYLSDRKRVSTKRRRTIMNEINRNRKENVRIELLTDVAKYEQRLYELINSNYMKHNGLPIYFTPNYLSELKKNLGPDCLVYISRKNGVITGCCILLKKVGVGHLYLTGVDRELSRNDKTYFNLCYYQPTRDAIANGLSKLTFGMGLHEIKTRRGCQMRNQFIYYKPRRKRTRLVTKPALTMISKWYARKGPQPGIKLAPKPGMDTKSPSRDQN